MKNGHTILDQMVLCLCSSHKSLAQLNKATLFLSGKFGNIKVKLSGSKVVTFKWLQNQCWQSIPHPAGPQISNFKNAVCHYGGLRHFVCQCNDHAVCACQKVNTLKFQSLSLFPSLLETIGKKAGLIAPTLLTSAHQMPCLYEYITIFLKSEI